MSGSVVLPGYHAAATERNGSDAHPHKPYENQLPSESKIHETTAQHARCVDMVQKLLKGKPKRAPTTSC